MRFSSRVLRACGRIVLVLAIAIPMMVAAPAWAECRQSFDIAADEIAGLPHQHTKRFAEAGLGIQFGYYVPNGGRYLSYIRFDMGYPSIDDALAEASLDQVRRDIRTVSSLNGVTLEGPGSLEPFVAGSVRLTNEIFLGRKGDAIAVEFLGFGHDGNCLHEVRFTAFVSPDASAIDEARTMYREVLQQLAPYIAAD